MHSGAYPQQPEQPMHGYGHQQQMPHDQMMQHNQQMQQQWAQQQQQAQHQQIPQPKFDPTASNQMHQYQQQQYPRPVPPNAGHNMDGASGMSGNMSGPQHGHTSPTRSGSVSSHSTTMMSPPPQSSASHNGRSHHARSHAALGPGKPPKGPEKPLIPYLRFSKSVWESVKKAHPGLQFADIGKIIGEQWRGCSAEQKAKFSEDYLKDKERYAQAQKIYLESPEYLEYLAAKTRREQQEEEDKKRRENATSASASPSRAAYAQHPAGGSGPESFHGQSSLHGPLEEMQSMSQRIIPPKLAPPAMRDLGAEVADEEMDDCLRAKHVASTRYRRNHRLLADVFSDAIVPDGRMIVTEQRMTVLQHQVSSLAHHQHQTETEQTEMVEKHMAKKQKLVADSEAFAEKLTKVKEEYKPVTKDQYQGMVDRYLKLLEKQWADVQAQNLARQQQATAVEEMRMSQTDSIGGTSEPAKLELEPISDEPLEAPAVTASNRADDVAAESAPSQSDREENDASSTEAVPGNVPEDVNDGASGSMEVGDIAGVGVTQITEELTEVQKPAVHFAESSCVDRMEMEVDQAIADDEENVLEKPAFTESVSEQKGQEGDEGTMSQAVAEEPSVAANVVEPKNADESIESETAEQPVPQSTKKAQQIDHSEAISSDDDSGAAPPENETEGIQSPEIPVNDFANHGTESAADGVLLSPLAEEQQILSPGSEGSVGQTLRDMVSSVASPTAGSSGAYADYAL